MAANKCLLSIIDDNRKAEHIHISTGMRRAHDQVRESFLCCVDCLQIEEEEHFSIFYLNLYPYLVIHNTTT